ncbi:hypothetical protein M408DRAFT_331672 [Serendipita vermifera MAFF 305830]|uniref:3'-5' exonuclease domain-containing protein n=1 Tax=Serendipita vermifera MAFF 305830 TaxID=933852 RepID=A0A0C2WE34_SERVB|nr:hypothetical protein M408DRAFT_331672 [Serendipita vermifera MAFF 305830]
MASFPGTLPDYPTASYRICNTPESLAAAVRVLSQHSHIFLDCEGRNLGTVSGKLSLLNLGVAHATDDGEQRLLIFLIDVLAFPKDRAHHLSPIFDIMSSEKVFKIVFDGRMDASELLHGHRVQLNNVLDLQVADILAREKRGESRDQQLQRLRGFLPKHELARNPDMYLYVHKLNGMGSAMREYGIDEGKKRSVNHDKWLDRPMDETSLRYAAEDICKIQQLYDVFMEEGYIDEETLVQQSASYLALNADARPRGDKYQGHGLFPLAVLAKVSPLTPLMQCRGCERRLPASCFARSKSRDRGHICFVCRAVDMSHKLSPRKRKQDGNSQL